MEHISEVIRTITRRLFPYMLLYGCYLISHGHLSPGGGFQGGVIFAAALILLALVEGVKVTEKRFREGILSSLKNIGMLNFIIIGMIGMAIHGFFLANFIPPQITDKIPNGGMILILNLTIAFMVAAGITVIFYRLIRHSTPRRFFDD